MTARRSSSFDWLVAETLVMSVIGLNALVLFLVGFPSVDKMTGGWLGWVDYGCLLYFIAEATVKIQRDTFSAYWEQGWNKMDLLIVIISSPLLLEPIVGGSVEFFSIVMVGRFLRFLRILRFVPNGPKIWAGVVRALKASMAVFLTLFVLNLIFALGANILFGGISSEYFGDPLRSAYSLFKVFTVEGWYEIPDDLKAKGAEDVEVMLLRIYFVVAVLIGGILGLSLANAVFVDEMTADNNDHLEEMVVELRGELEAARAHSEQDQAERWRKLNDTLQDIQSQLADLQKDR